MKAEVSVEGATEYGKDSAEERGGYRGRAWGLSWKDATELGR